ncbi:hypothetical protein SD70_09830 [Gordoniibacillus kamchatkensis]|uniref:Uncharacterized protein n=1 Tax=Gordoniibacillus kamchatkensis TaxID=1590651 RepID=A0ABR5AJ58_9BACL|nr:hypothetical protein [Paenibacillus sp. VKM B-2647]KIL41084.1 hypothetical protein SD70_09830 [Paenibacillus sp. VKM B-2647]
MIATTQELYAWFEQHTGQTLTIDKEEGGDRDRVRLKLERIERTESGEQADDYLVRRSFRLIGAGTIHNPGGEPVELPSGQYEIALDGLVSHTESAGAITIKTTRAAYRIQA